MKRLLIATALTLPIASYAQPIFHPTGPNLTFGMNSHSPSVVSAVANPAAGAATAAKEETTMAIGLISSVGVSMELGKVDNYANTIDDLTTRLDQTGITAEEADAIKAEFDDFLQQAEEDGYLIINGAVHVPLLPLMVTSETLGGTLTFDINAGVQAYAGVLYSPLIYNELLQEMETNSAMYIKGAMITEASAGFSRQVWKSPYGDLFAGVTGKYYQVDLTKNVISLNNVDDDMEETLSDEMDQNQASSSDFGLDLGILWVSNMYSLGATLRNANAPEFDYGAVGSNCASLSGSAQANCYTAASHANKIDLTETYTMDPQLSLEASIHSSDQHWQLAASYDTNAVRGPIGNEIQWMTVALGYAPDNWIPGVRIGYRENLAGSQLSMATFGLTLLKGLNLDIAYGLEEVEHEDEKYPRTAAVNLGLELRF